MMVEYSLEKSNIYQNKFFEEVIKVFINAKYFFSLETLLLIVFERINFIYESFLYDYNLKLDKKEKKNDGRSLKK